MIMSAFFSNRNLDAMEFEICAIKGIDYLNHVTRIFDCSLIKDENKIQSKRSQFDQ